MSTPTLTEAEAVKILSNLLTEARQDASGTTTAAPTGACLYRAGSKDYCAVVTQADCVALGGKSWTEGAKCP